MGRGSSSDAEWTERLQKILAREGVKGLSHPVEVYFKRYKRQLVGGIIAVFLLSFMLNISLVKTSRRMKDLSPDAELTEYEQWQKAVRSNSSPSKSIFGSCNIEPPIHPSQPLNPILSASFPGGPSDVIRFLVEAETGLWTGARSYRDDVVAIKTHYPYYSNHVRMRDMKGEEIRAFVIMQNPLKAMQAWHSFIEKSYEKPADISARDVWIEWRDLHLVDELKNWETFLRYWLSVPRSSRFFVVEEDLLSDKTGPNVAKQLLQFIEDKIPDIPTAQPIDNIPCLWYQVIQSVQRDSSAFDNDESISREDVRPYTYFQLDLIASLLTNLINDYGSESQLIQILLKYRVAVMAEMEKMKNEEPLMVTNTFGSCMVTTPSYEEKLTPIFQASYPGSGSEMLRDLIESLTGISTGAGKRRNDVVSMKTYHPRIHDHLKPGFWNRDMKRVILLVRNPLDSIPSYYDHLYWNQKNIAEHSIQVQKEDWERWRDKMFLKEFDKWVKLFTYWTGKFGPSERLILSFEDLLHNKRGPKQATRLALFIKGNEEDSIVTTAPTYTIPCLWYRAVKMNDDKNSYKGTKTYLPSFTNRQMEVVATKFHHLYEKYNYDLHLGPIFRTYWEDTIKRMNQ